jgi:glutamine synthetase
MVPSSASVAGPNTILNTIVTEALDEIATRLEKASNVDKEIEAIVKETWKKHGKVVFNGNNYAEELVQEAEKRGLPNIRSSVEAYGAMATESAVQLFEKYKVLSKRELHSRHEIYLEQYAKHINIEARAAIQMAKIQYFPAVAAFSKELADTVNAIKAAGGDSTVVSEHLTKVTGLFGSAVQKLEVLETARTKADAVGCGEEKAIAYRDHVFTAQTALRQEIDALETIVSKKHWPVPSYADMLFNF